MNNLPKIKDIELTSKKSLIDSSISPEKKAK